LFDWDIRARGAKPLNRFSIRDIETLTGVKAHTLRIWEQRYGLVSPKRTQTNIRFYDDDDLRLLLNVSLLNERGFRISELARMNHGQLQQLVQEQTLLKVDDYAAHLQALTVHMLELNERAFDKVINTSVLQIGLENCMLNVVFPFLHNVGVLWQTGAINPAHEHFISNIIRQKLIVAIDGQQYSYDDLSRRYLLFLPEGEFHEIGLLFSNYLIQSRGHRVIYLGQNIPLADVEQVYAVYAPHYVVTALTSPLPNNKATSTFIQELNDAFASTTVYISGMQLYNYSETLPKNVVVLGGINSLIEVVSKEN